MNPSSSEVTIGLVMIVKNEELTLPRLATSLDGQLNHWTIVDTGSTDDTVSVAKASFAGVPGEVIEDEWRGFGPSRNVALNAGRPHSDWLLSIDADETVVGSLEFSVDDEIDGIMVEEHFEPLRWWVPKLVRASSPWEWRGRAHEYLTLTEGQARFERTTSFHIAHHADGGNRGTKFDREIALLQADLRDDPNDPRTVFYIARTYEDSGEFPRAATWYRKRVKMEGWEEETWYSTWRLGRCLLASGKHDEGCGVLLRAWGWRPWRAEPLWSLAEHCRLHNQWRLGFEACELARRHCGIEAAIPGNGFGGDQLFVHDDVYAWRIDYEQSIAAYYVGERELGRALIDNLMRRHDLPPEIAASVESNLRFYDGKA